MTIYATVSSWFNTTIDSRFYTNALSLYRIEKLGHIAPGEVMSAITDTNSYITALALNGIVASTGNPFIVLKNNRIVKNKILMS